jgi:hypothetical protein
MAKLNIFVSEDVQHHVSCGATNAEYAPELLPVAKPADAHDATENRIILPATVRRPSRQVHVPLCGKDFPEEAASANRVDCLM